MVSFYMHFFVCFCFRLCDAYNRMSDPPFIQVDANGTKEEVVEIVLKNLELHGIHLE